MSSKAALVVPALTKHTGTVIMAHGLGDSGAGWVGLAENWRKRNKFEEIAFIFPNAPVIPITVNFNMRMPGWYDITSFDKINATEDENGILRSRDTFNALIEGEIEKGIASDRIVLGGFSQGGAMSLFTFLTSSKKLGGVCALSSYLLLRTKLQELIPKDSLNQNTPIFMGHGDEDPLVKYEWAQSTAKYLEETGWNVNLNTYKGLEHSADPQEIDDLEAYLSKRLPPLGDKGHSEL